MSESDDSLLRSLRNRLFSRTHITAGGCIEYTGYCQPNGYGRLGFGREYIMAHRAAWLLAHGPIPEGMVLCHKCDNPPCINVDHLFVGTQQDNQLDKLRKGRGAGARGLSNGQGKLDSMQVVAIKARYKKGVRANRRTGRSAAELAAEFGITPQYVNQIGRGVHREQG